MDCARLNFSHGDHQSHAAMAKLIREVAGEARRPMAILADMQGPKMRIGKFAKGSIELAPDILVVHDPLRAARGAARLHAHPRGDVPAEVRE